MRKNKLLLSLFSIVMLLAISVPVQAAKSPQLPLPGKMIPQFVQPLPRLSVQAGGTVQTIFGNQALAIRMCEFKANVLPANTVPGYAGTWVWGYLPDPTGTSTCNDLVNQYSGGTGVMDTYIGPVIVNDRGGSTDINWINDLGSAATTNVLAYKYSTDQTIHWADPLNGGMNMCAHMAMPPAPGSECAQNYNGSIPAAVHLHGGEVPPELDGGPEAWYTSDGLNVGKGFYSFGWDGSTPQNYAVYKYPNVQEAAPLWFHDHTLGATRLNVFSGLAGGYYLEDPALWSANRTTTRGTAGTCTSGCLPDNLQSVGEVIPLVLQDRMFDTNGQLFFQADGNGNIQWALNPEHPYWSPEFVGDTIVVNGKAWPYLEVQPKRYRFLLLNGSNARTYEMFITNPTNTAAAPNMWVISDDGGYLDSPVNVKKLVVMPGERYEVIIDFAGIPLGTNLVLTNTAKTPYPGGAAPQGSTLGRVLQIRVNQNLVEVDASYDPVSGIALRSGANATVRLNPANVNVTRTLTLNEIMGMPQTVTDPVTGQLTVFPGGPLEILVNNSKWSGERVTGVGANGMYTMQPIPGSIIDSRGNYLTEIPNEGNTEVWEIVNLTADAHPIHLHLVQFQILSRQSFDAKAYSAAYAAAFPGGGYDPMTMKAYPTGVFIPGFGPPLPIDGSDTRSGGKLGGNLDVSVLGNNGKPVYLQGKAILPNAYESGWKDTLVVYPGQVTRFITRWAPTSLPAGTAVSSAFFPFDPSAGYVAGSGNPFAFGYVWHCHIIDHEDNEMMRPDAVYPNLTATRTIMRGIDY